MNNLKEELQKEAIEAHIQKGKKSTICASVGSGNSFGKFK